MRTLMFLMLYAVLLPLPSYAQSDLAVRIVAPAPETTIYDNNGNLSVEVALSQAPDTVAIDQLTLLMDGTAVAKGRDLSFELNNIDRGTHTLQVQVFAANGKLLATSPPVVFHMWRASLLFKNRTQPK